MKKNKKRALELLQQRESDPKITCQWIGDETGYSRKQIERFAMELKERICNLSLSMEIPARNR